MRTTTTAVMLNITAVDWWSVVRDVRNQNHGHYAIDELLVVFCPRDSVQVMRNRIIIILIIIPGKKRCTRTYIRRFIIVCRPRNMIRIQTASIGDANLSINKQLYVPLFTRKYSTRARPHACCKENLGVLTVGNRLFVDCRAQVNYS